MRPSWLFENFKINTSDLKAFLKDWFAYFVKRFLIATVIFVTLIVATQDLQIFPGLLIPLFGDTYMVPADVEEFRVTTKDNEVIPVWRVTPLQKPRKQVILLLHGNGEVLATFVNVAKWFASNGFVSYAMEYRGFQGSTGLPSERGLYLDGEAAIDLLIKEEKVDPHDIIVFGASLGTGPAAYLAQKYEAGTLILVAPYTSLKMVVEERPLFRYFTPFLWYRFPTYDYVNRLKDTCVIDAHGKQDKIIRFHHSEDLKRAYNGTKSYTLIASDEARHGDVFAIENTEILKELDHCLAKGIA